jgi:hypothetical protein
MQVALEKTNWLAAKRAFHFSHATVTEIQPDVAVAKTITTSRELNLNVALD